MMVRCSAAEKYNWDDKMRTKFSNLSVNKKSMLLLLTFVLLPLMTGGWIILDQMSQQWEKSEQNAALQRIHYINEKIAQQLDTIKRISDTLSVHEAIHDVVVKEDNSIRHYESNQVMMSTLAYNDQIIKVQLLLSGKVIWQYGGSKRYVFQEEGNEQYAALIDQQEKTSFWSPAHTLYRLSAGKFEEAVPVVSYYSGIYETKKMQQNGVLALHVAEESICNSYWNSLYGNPMEAWMVMDNGEVFSATEKSWLESGLPVALQIKTEGKTEGSSVVDYNGKDVVLIWEKCSDLDGYLVQMNEKKVILHTYALIVCLVFLLLVFMGAGYLHFYKIYVTGPLKALTIQMERAKNLDLRQELLPVQGDEIGVLTTTFQGMLSHIDELIGKIYVEKIKTQEAEQKLMLSQMNPHFLYNTLDSIRWNALSHGDKEVAKQMEALSLMLRNTLNFGKTDTTIGQEIQTIENYCYLFQARFRKNIEVEINVDPCLIECHIPKLLIQPLVENAYQHGLENKSGFKKIWVKIRKVNNKMHIYVADNGVGCEKEEIIKKMEEESGDDCFALKNIRDRIDLDYGKEGIFSFTSRSGAGTLVKLALPLSGIEFPVQKDL